MNFRTLLKLGTLGAFVVAAACSSEAVLSGSDTDAGFGTRPGVDSGDQTADDSGVDLGDTTLNQPKDSGSGSDVKTDAPKTDGSSISDSAADAPLPQLDAATSGANGKLVINEVDYDQVNADDNEYVEIYNPDLVNAVSLQGIALVFVAGGAGSGEYLRVDLSGQTSLPAGGYLVVASNTVTVAATAKVIRFAAASNNIRNARNGNPEAIGILDTNTNTLLDALSYGGAVTGFNEGTATTALDSNEAGMLALIRNPNGTDTGNAATDWALTTTLTPGLVNVYTP